MAAKFDYSLDYKNLDLRKNPELYRIGKGEQGVLTVEPYRTEIVQHWRFKTPEIAHASSAKIYEMFLEYKKQKDFVGMDMVRKFLQMGITRARRYANHPSGRKYKKGTREIIPIEKIDEEKAESAKIFSEKYYLAKNDIVYQAMMKAHKEKYETEE
jgi:predicted nucleic acid-binding protein